MNLRINLNEAAFANGRSGTLDAEMAESWLNGLESWACSPMAYAYWTEARVNYIASFGERVDAVYAARPECATTEHRGH